MDTDCWSSAQIQAPAGLRATPNGPEIDLTWNQVIDARIMGYRLYRDGSLLAVTALLAFTDQSPGVGVREYTVTAYSETEESQEGAPASAQIEVSISVSPATATVVPGGSIQFLATVENADDQSVTWSTTSGAISDAGLLAAPDLSTLITVTATSVIRPDASGTASVMVAIPAVAGFNPILEPTLPIESTAVYEPNILYEDGRFVMLYSGGWSTPGVFRAESYDGVAWTKSGGRAIGLGAGGESGVACRPTVIKHSGVYYCYYVDAAGGGANWRRASSMDSITWSGAITVAASTLIPGRNGFANSTVWVEGSTWFALCEAFSGSGVTWQTYLLSSEDGVSWAVMNSGSALTSLQVAVGGMYGGPNLFRGGVVDGVYHLFYHAAPVPGTTPTNLYHATSTDKITWTRTTAPLLVYSGDGMGFDQIADPSVFEAAGSLYLFYDQTDNRAESAYIGVAKLAGGLAEFLNGGTFVRVDKKPDRRTGSDPVEYWNLTEPSGVRSGSVSGIGLIPSGAVSTTTGPGGSAAVRLSSDGALIHVSTDELQVGNFDWTITGWVRISDQSYAPAVLSKSASSPKQYDLYVGEPDGLRFVAYKSGTEYASVYGTPGAWFPNGTWVFFRIWHSCSEDVIGVQVDNGPKRTNSWVGGVCPTGVSDFVIGSFGSSNVSTRDFSRVGFWKRLLSDSEATQLYNSGNGMLWPF